MLEMIVSAFIIGFFVAIPLGIVTFVATQKSILYGFKSSLFLPLGLVFPMFFTFSSYLIDWTIVS